MRVHCCDEMCRHLEVGDVPAAAAAPGRHIVYDAVFDEYCLVREGGLDAAPISHCPFCGATLPASKRDLWFAELALRGLSPDDEGLDDAFRSDAWWSRPLPPPADDGRTAPGLRPPDELRPPASSYGPLPSPLTGDDPLP
jgi:hypothetical protein